MLLCQINNPKRKTKRVIGISSFYCKQGWGNSLPFSFSRSLFYQLY